MGRAVILGIAVAATLFQPESGRARFQEDATSSVPLLDG